MVRIFVKKPVVIQAIRWDGNNIRELSEFMIEKKIRHLWRYI